MQPWKRQGYCDCDVQRGLMPDPVCESRVLQQRERGHRCPVTSEASERQSLSVTLRTGSMRKSSVVESSMKVASLAFFV